MSRSINKALIAILGMFVLIVLANRILLCFSFDTNLGGIEETFVYLLQRAMLNLNLYQQPDEPPFFLNQYAPLYFWLSSHVLDLFGVKATEVRELFISGRLLQVLWNALTSAVIVLILRQELETGIRTAIVGGLLAFLLFFPHHYAIRPDSLKCLGFFVSFYLLFKGIRTQKKWLVILAGVVAAFATLTKQDAFVLFILFSCFTIIYSYSALLLYSGTYLMIGFLFIVSLMSIYESTVLYKNLFIGVQQGISLKYFVYLLEYIYHYLFFFLLCVVIFYPYRHKFNKLDKTLTGLTVICLCIQLLTCLKWGSSPVYLTESLFLLLLTGAGLFYKLDSKRKRVLLSGIFLMLLIDFSSNVNKKWYSAASQKGLKKEQKVYKILRAKIDSLKEPRKIFIQHKPALSYFPTQAIFPTYESECPHAYFCYTRSKMNNNIGMPDKVFDYSKWQDNKHLTNKNIIILKEDGCPLPSMFENRNRKVLVDTSHYKLLQN